VDSLEIGHGESVFIQGESGSGKTTLLSIIAGILSPSSGSVRVLGRELGGMPPAMRDQFRADHIGFIFQQFNLLPYLGMKDNVALVTRFSRRRRANSRKESEQEIRRCLAALGLDDHDIGTRSVRDLSVGQQQRVAIARALLGSPELVIADEPTSALDAKSRDTFLSVLFRECERSGATLLFVSHDPSLSGRFDHCLELDSGRLKTETPSQ
jgi:putative ABC transport system ATP-binding protein